MVIICTDGLANKGFGAIDLDLKKAEEFYIEVGEQAKKYGIAVSIITIKGEGCRTDILSKVAEKT